MVVTTHNRWAGNESIGGRAKNSTRNRKVKPNLLAPCPFCGGEATVRHAPFTCIICSQCGSRGPTREHAGEQDVATATLRWNTRRSL